NFDFQNNLTLFSSILKLAPNHVKATYAIATNYEKLGDLTKAEQYYKKVLEMAPNYIPVYSALGNFYLTQRDYNQALPFLTQAVLLEPTSGRSQVALSRLYMQRKEYIKAVECLQIATKNSSPNAKLQHELALAYFYAKDLEKAELEMRKSIDLDPYFAEPQINLARILQKQNKPEQAQTLLDKALALTPNDPDAYTLYGVGLRMKADICGAKDYLLKALSINAQLPEAHYELGLVYAEMHLYSEARQELETSLKLNPTNTEARQKLFELNKKALNPKPAIKCPS
ncbi:MAG: TPR domain protein, partial [bacterium]